MSMIRSMIKASAGLFAAAMIAAPVSAIAAGGKQEIEHVHWHFSGPFATYDKDALQRGFQVYRTICASCHGMELLSFRNLGDKGGPFYLDKCPEGVAANVNCSNPNENPIVKAIAAEYQITDGPDDFGDMFQRAGLPSDRFPNPYPNEQIARLANNGALPPDMSLIAKARKYGPDYLYSLLTGYRDTPESVTVAAGQYYNVAYPGDMSQNLKPEYRDADGHVAEGAKVPPGGVFAMPSPLSEGVIDYADEETPETVEQYAKDVTEFLMWAAEPKMEQRKSMGIVVVGYLIVLAFLLYWSYKQLWSRVDH